MLEVLKLQQYPADVLYFAAIAALIMGAIGGYLADAIMRNRGFKPSGNAVLVTIGALLGIYVRNVFFGTLQNGDVVITGLFAAACTTLILLGLGFIKKLVQD